MAQKTLYKKLLTTIFNSIDPQIKKEIDKIFIYPDDYLEKDYESTPKLFRFLEKNSKIKKPIWVDFENGVIIKHPIIDELYKEIENNTNYKYFIIAGGPGTCKSTILRNIVYDFYKKKDIYFYNFRKFLNVINSKSDCLEDSFNWIIENKEFFDNKNTIFLFDNIHLYFEKFYNFILQSNLDDAKIIATFTKQKLDIENNPYSSPLTYLERRSGIKGIKIIEVIKDDHKNFLTEVIKKYCLTKTPPIRNLSDENINFILDLIKSGNEYVDIFTLAYLLTGWDGATDRLDWDKIYENFYNIYIEPISPQYLKLLLIIAPFSLLELDLDSKYLNEFEYRLELSEIIKNFKKIGILIEEDNYFRIFHPLPARILLESIIKLKREWFLRLFANLKINNANEFQDYIIKHYLNFKLSVDKTFNKDELERIFEKLYCNGKYKLLISLYDYNKEFDNLRRLNELNLRSIRFLEILRDAYYVMFTQKKSEELANKIINILDKILEMNRDDETSISIKKEMNKYLNKISSTPMEDFEDEEYDLNLD